MLSERKKKNKWNLNPRGNFWSNDEQKYGQRIMEKMGWQRGKGLGKSEDGMVDNIKAVYKCDNNGIGWEEKLNGWISHQDDFDDLLNNLNNSYSTSQKPTDSFSTTESDVVSLEKRAKLFRSRLHYKKFLKGKDVTQYSEKDVESIIGKKFDKNFKVVESKEYDEQHHNKNHVATTSDIDASKNQDVTFNSSLTIADYFSEKLRNKSTGKVKDEQTKSAAVELSATDIPATSVEAVTDDNVDKKKKKKKRRIPSNENPEETALDENEVHLAAKKTKLVNANTECTTPVSEESLEPDNISEKTIKSCLKKEIPSKERPRKSVTFNELPSEGINELDSECIDTVKESDDNKICSSNKDSKLDPESNELRSVNQDIEDSKNKEDSLKCNIAKLTTSNEFPKASNSKKPTENETNKDAIVDSEKSNSNEAGLAFNMQQNSQNPVSFWAQHPFVLGNFPKTVKIGHNNDSWNNTLKMAEKMSHYAAVLKNLQMHDVLCTTNLIDIRGYGN